MEKLIDAIENALSDNNYIVAVMAAVTIPDICGKIEFGEKKKHYKRWFEAYMPEIYSRHVGGGDAYAIRCALLHSFNDSLTSHRAREVLAKYQFTWDGSHLLSVRDLIVNGRRVDNITIINPKVYTEDLIHACKTWRDAASGDLRSKITQEEVASPLFSNQGNIGGPGAIVYR